jgi:hypothetical protein
VGEVVPVLVARFVQSFGFEEWTLLDALPGEVRA